MVRLTMICNYTKQTKKKMGLGEEKRDQRCYRRNYNSNSIIRFNNSFAPLGEGRVRLLAYIDTKSGKY